MSLSIVFHIYTVQTHSVYQYSWMSTLYAHSRYLQCKARVVVLKSHVTGTGLNTQKALRAPQLTSLHRDLNITSPFQSHQRTLSPNNSFFDLYIYLYTFGFLEINHHRLSAASCSSRDTEHWPSSSNHQSHHHIGINTISALRRRYYQQ